MSVLHVIVPAHNEQAVIERCLARLTSVPLAEALRVTVVCNGCSDRTVQIARGWAGRDARIDVLELAAGSKTAAIRAGLAAATPDAAVAVVDADVVLDSEAVQGLAAGLTAAGGPVIATPRIAVDLAGCSTAVRSYYRVWLRQPYVTGGLIGAGVYAVSAAGRSRLEAMPDVLGDDAWARAQFTPEQRRTTPGTFTVFAARSVGALVRRRARILEGNAELRAREGRPAAPPGTPEKSALVDRVVFRGVSDCAALLVRWRRLRGRSRVWGTDTTSRVPARP